MELARIRLRAALASWGGIVTDGRPSPFPIPVPSWLTGLLGAACGISWHDADQLQAIQDGLDYAVVQHRPGVPVSDFQTADLAQPWLDARRRATHNGRRIKRESSTDKVVQHRHLWADVDTTLLVHCACLPANAIDEALQHPAFPLYLGRGDCHPAAPLAGGVLTAESLEAAAAAEPPGVVWLPAPIGAPGSLTLGGLRNWHTRRFAGVRAWRRRTNQPGGSDQS